MKNRQAIVILTEDRIGGRALSLTLSDWGFRTYLMRRRRELEESTELLADVALLVMEEQPMDYLMVISELIDIRLLADRTIPGLILINSNLRLNALDAARHQVRLLHKPFEIDALDRAIHQAILGQFSG
jgi:DNA-binding NtrC family response regulator